MRLSEELELALLLERRVNEFDLEWINGVKKGWQQIYKERKKYPGRLVKGKYKNVSPKRDHKVVQDAVKSAEKYTRKVKSFLELLQQDLMINKGFWHIPGKNKGSDELEKEKSKIVRALNNAMKKLEIPRPNEYGHDDFMWSAFRGHPAFSFSDKEGMDGVLRGVAVRVEENIDKINGILNRGIWKPLEQVIKKYGKGRGTDAKNSFSISQGLEPTELNVGAVRVHFDEVSVDPLMRGRKWDDPKGRGNIIKALVQAQKILKKRGMEKVLWYGDMYVRPIESKNKKGRLLAKYLLVGDYVEIYGEPGGHEELVRTIIHELGHRYYYRIMGKEDRDRFNKWYGQVKATSAYGSTRTWEDFAEVFMEYIYGKMKLSRSQIERFLASIGHRPVIDEPRMGGVPVRGLYAGKSGPKVAFQGEGSVNWDDYEDILAAIRDMDRDDSLGRFKRMWRRGIVFRQGGKPPLVNYDEGVLVINTSSPRMLGSGRALERKIFVGAAMAYYNSEFVSSKMRSAWEELMSEMIGSGMNFDVLYGSRLYSLVALQHSPDEKVMETLYWTLGMLAQPAWVDDRKKKAFVVPTPAQMHKKTGMLLPGMEHRNRLSTLLEGAVRGGLPWI
jgi:hypothetical protein